MKIFDGLYTWEGWGGILKLGSGRCRLLIFDLDQDDPKTRHLKPIIVVVADVPGGRMSVKSCAGNIATGVVQKFSIDPARMIWVEHYPASVYGEKGERRIGARFESVDFTWKEQKAIQPRWRNLSPSLLVCVKELLKEVDLR